MSDDRVARVLVVEDDERVRGLLCDLLADWGCQAVEAANGAEALGFFADGDYDLVVTDHRMPGLTGLELVEELRDRDGAVEVIMFTASAPDLERDSRRLAFTLLEKPLQIVGLKAAVDQALLRRATGATAALR